jgi:sugar lactone lactonase YvrE
MTTVEHVLSVHNDLGEGPIWHPQEQALYWIDITRGGIHRYDPASGEHTRYQVAPPVTCIAMRAGGGFMVSRARSVDAWDRVSQTLAPIATFKDDEVGQRFNDGAVDAQGRFWVGSMSDARRGFLYRLDPGQPPRSMKSGIGCGNGIGWSPDRRVMYFTDSERRIIYAFDFDPASGALEHERVFAQTADLPGQPPEGLPDGLTVDTEGCVWSARWDGWKIVRYDPDGDVMAEFPVPVQRPTSVMFGGPALDTLYITTARNTLSAAQLADQPLAGDLFCLRAGARGLPEPAFAG